MKSTAEIINAEIKLPAHKQIVRKGSVPEAGCSSAAFPETLAKNNPRLSITGIDISEGRFVQVNIKRANTKKSRPRWQVLINGLSPTILLTSFIQDSCSNTCSIQSKQ